MTAAWRIEHWPDLLFDAFLSHSREDKADLVAPVWQRLCSLGVTTWFDREDYRIATDPLEALRNSLLRCRHVIYFITPEFLAQGRGWCAAERTYSNLIQRHFEYSTTTLWNFELPLIYLPLNPSSQADLARTVWGQSQKADWFDLRAGSQASRVDWAVERITSLLDQQRAELTDVKKRIRADTSLDSYLKSFRGLKARVTSMLPPQLPPGL